MLLYLRLLKQDKIIIDKVSVTIFVCIIIFTLVRTACDVMEHPIFLVYFQPVHKLHFLVEKSSFQQISTLILVGKIAVYSDLDFHSFSSSS